MLVHVPVALWLIGVMGGPQIKHAPLDPRERHAPVDVANHRVLDAEHQWAQWRGPLGTGVAPFGDPPVTWSERQNVRWKKSIPGLGHSTPVIWGDRIILTTAIPAGPVLDGPLHDAPGAHDNTPPLRQQMFVVMALDRENGAVLWQRTMRTERPHESSHVTGSWASNSPVTDGERVYASFGSRGLYCLDMAGDVLWQTDIGEMRTKHGHGEGSSPALFGESLVINRDHEGDSRLIALDKRSGQQRWSVPRDEGSSWSTPLIVVHDGAPQVIVAATKRVRGYDLSTGALLWECAGLSGNVVASPVAAEGVVIAANSYDTQAMLAIRLDKAIGDITGTDAVLWTRDRWTPYVPSPVLDDGRLFFLRHYQGQVLGVDARTGRTLFGPERLPGIANVFASLAAAAGRIYIVDRDGAAAVLRNGDRMEVLARNQLDESFSASPAILGTELFLRGEHHLYCIAGPLP